MGGTKAGGQASAKTNIEKHGPDFYKRIGRLGGSTRHTDQPRGFAAMSEEKVAAAGKKGGKRSRRTYTPEQREAFRQRLIKARLQRLDDAITQA